MVMVMWWDGFGDWKGIKVGRGVIGVAVALKMMWWGRLWPTSRVGVTNTTKAEARSVPPALEQQSSETTGALLA